MADELIRVRVRQKAAAAQDIALFELVHRDGAALPAFAAGSHIDVHIGEDRLRQYSLCNDPAETQRYRIAVLREPAGTGGSAWMHDQLTEGAEIAISAPRNSFHLDESAGYSLLLAGGIGVTPMLAMARRLHALGRPFDLHYCTRSAARTAFRDELASAAFADRVHFHFDDGDAGQRLDIPALLRERPADGHLYVCGPPGFMQAVLDNAAAAWPPKAVHREYFSNDPSAGHDDDGSFTVRVASTGQEFAIPADRSIVEVLGEAGVEIPVSCEQGICGTCITPVLEGEPDHRDLFMTDAEHAANKQITPCCSRALGDLIVLDL